MIKLIVSLLALWGLWHLWRWVERATFERQWREFMQPWEAASDETWLMIERRLDSAAGDGNEMA